MRLFVISGALPLAGHSTRAPTVVTREALAALRALGHDVVLQPLLPPEREPDPVAEAGALQWCAAAGIELLPTLDGPLDRIGPTPGRLAWQALSRDPGDFYPSYEQRAEMAARVRASEADVAMHIWTPPAFAACADLDRPVFAYAGNPDHYSFGARLKHPALFELPTATLRNRVKLALWKAAYRRFESIVVRLAHTTTWLACVSAPNADYYTAKGHPRAFYLQNMWPKLAGIPDELPSPTENRIVGNIGAQWATGNTFGVAFLGREVLPELDRLLGDDYEVHLYGTGHFWGEAAEAAKHLRVRNRGFVDDIDAELRSAKVFLLANNSDPDYVVGHTRVLHAWSLGSCLVTTRGMARAMPEIVHGENALLGETGAELAGHVAAVFADDGLRRRIAAGGRSTWEREFRPEVVMRRAVDRIERDLSA